LGEIKTFNLMKEKDHLTIQGDKNALKTIIFKKNILFDYLIWK
jgi:hypothetical protein